ncbi:MAG: serine/threonine-protein kinase [Chloroflexota bacterium]
MAKPKWIGKSLSNRYVIEELLGQGGMSAVYKATDPNLKRVVAIKMIHTHLSNDPDFVKRFEEEATAVAQLRHPNIIQVYDFNRDDDVYYMVLEFVPGETLQDHLKRLNQGGRRLSVTSAMEYIANACDAVDYAHQRGMIHRDIKPANLMLNTLGQVILMDFGIAKIVGGQRHTATGAVVGTAMYMSPEQIKGEQPDRRTDIYSLGVTLFELVSGQPPFDADSAMTLMMMHVNDPVPDPRKLNPDVPDDLVAVINKALAKDPNERYQTAAQMAAALRNALGRVKTGVSPAAVPPGATMVDSAVVPPGSTMVEESVLTPGATRVDEAVVPPGSTMVEEAAIPSVGAQGTVVESGPLTGPGTAARPAPAPSAPTASTRPKSSGMALPMIIGGVVGGACLLIGGIFMVSQLFGDGSAGATEAPIVAVVDTPTEFVLPTATAGIEETPTAEVTPTDTATPTATVPAGPFVRINVITVDSQNRYVVEYETFGFTEQLPGMHIHFFFNTVPPENAGVPGSGPWILYGGPRPFTGYRVSDRPGAATQMCALVANSNHSIQYNSGNCVDLPQ